jgi:hypothetical protein
MRRSGSKKNRHKGTEAQRPDHTALRQKAEGRRERQNAKNAPLLLIGNREDFYLTARSGSGISTMKSEGYSQGFS